MFKFSMVIFSLDYRCLSMVARAALLCENHNER
jgi:hypothetical protein